MDRNVPNANTFFDFFFSERSAELLTARRRTSNNAIIYILTSEFTHFELFSGCDIIIGD